MANGVVKLLEIIARNRAVHVVLRVPVHVPVQESNGCAGYEGARVQPKVCNSLVQAHVLRGIA